MKKIVNFAIYYDNEEEIITYISAINSLTCTCILDLVFTVNKIDLEKCEGLQVRLQQYTTHRVYIYNPKQNLGYLDGLLYGYQKYSKLKGSADYVIFSNTDIEYPDKEIFNKMLSNHYNSNIWAIAPSIFAADEKVFKNPQVRIRPSNIKMAIKQIVLTHYVLTSCYCFIRKFRKSKHQIVPTDSDYIYQAHGCYIIFLNDMMKHFEKFHYGVLLFGEEDVIAEFIHKNLKKIYYDSSLRVTHIAHTTTGKSINAKKLIYYRKLACRVLTRLRNTNLNKS